MFENETDFNNFTDYLLFLATLTPSNSKEVKIKEFAICFLNNDEYADNLVDVFDHAIDTNGELFDKYVKSRSKEDISSVKTTLNKIKLDMLFECD
jgi:hypothetical protein